MTPFRQDPQPPDRPSPVVCGRCGKPSTVLVLDPAKPYVYLCASCETNNPAGNETARTSGVDAEDPA